MNKYIRNTGLLMLKGLLLFNQAHADELTVGSVAPDFILKDQNFKTHTLADYKGQWVVLYFYPKNDTPGCTTEACSFRDDIYQIKALNAQIIGVSLDDSESHEVFAKKYNLPFTLLADTEAEVAKAYGSLLNLGIIEFALRQTFIIDPNGLIQKIYRDVEPEGHSGQVITDLKTLRSKDIQDQGES